MKHKSLPQGNIRSGFGELHVYIGGLASSYGGACTFKLKNSILQSFGYKYGKKTPIMLYFMIDFIIIQIREVTKRSF